MSRSGFFFNKVSRQSIFWGQQVDLLSWLCFVRYLLLPFFAFFLHSSQLFKGGALCHGLTLANPLQKSETVYWSHCIGWQREDFSASQYSDTKFLILAQGRTSFHLSTLEAMFIKFFQPNLCRHKEFFYSLKLIH